MKDKIFSVLQRVGRSFMLPIAVLPVAGLLLGVGSSYTNTTTIATYGLEHVLGSGTMLNALLTIMSKAGNVIFDNLPIIFAVGVAIGMSKAEKEVAALSAMIAFLVMHVSINAVLTISGKILPDGSIAPGVMEGTIASVCGMETLQMGVFGGIIVGLGVAALHNRYHKIVLPNALSFFGGSHFIPIISAIVYVGVGILMYFLWPAVQNGIYILGSLVTGTGYLGTLIFGIIKRPDSVRSSPRFLYAFLANCRRRNHDGRRKSDPGWTEYILCATGIPGCTPFQCRCHPLFFRGVYIYDFRSSRCGTCHVPLCEAGKKAGGRRSFALGCSHKYAYRNYGAD